MTCKRTPFGTCLVLIYTSVSHNGNPYLVNHLRAYLEEVVILCLRILEHISIPFMRRFACQLVTLKIIRSWISYSLTCPGNNVSHAIKDYPPQTVWKPETAISRVLYKAGYAHVNEIAPKGGTVAITIVIAR